MNVKCSAQGGKRIFASPSNTKMLRTLMQPGIYDMKYLNHMNACIMDMSTLLLPFQPLKQKFTSWNQHVTYSIHVSFPCNEGTRTRLQQVKQIPIHSSTAFWLQLRYYMVEAKNTSLLLLLPTPLSKMPYKSKCKHLSFKEIVTSNVVKICHMTFYQQFVFLEFLPLLLNFQL